MLGGDSCHRGSLLGAILGAVHGSGDKLAASQPQFAALFAALDKSAERSEAVSTYASLQ